MKEERKKNLTSINYVVKSFALIIVAGISYLEATYVG